HHACLVLERLAGCHTRLARLIEGRCLRAEPNVLPFDHVSASCLPSWRGNDGGRSMRRSTISCPAAHRRDDTSAVAGIDPRTLACINASANRRPERRAASRHGSQRQENEVADGEIQTVVI